MLRGRVLWGLATAVAACGGVAFASAGRPPATVDEPVDISGGMTLLWHGDPGRGCATQNLCSTHGSVVIQFTGYGNLQGNRSGPGLALDGLTAIARVRRDDPQGAGECVDTVATNQLGITFRHGQNGWQAVIDGGSLSSGRCAGPLNGDVGRIVLPIRRLPGRRLAFDLGASATVPSGPFTGTFLSTARVTPDLSSSFSSSSGSSTSYAGPATPRPRRVRVEYASVRYRLTAAPASLQYSFFARPAPSCTTLDSCGTGGELTLATGGVSRILTIAGTRTVPRAVSARTALVDLRAGRLNTASSGLFAKLSGSVSETMTRGGVGACSDQVPQRLSLAINYFEQFPAHAALPLQLGSSLDGPNPSLLRTHCPGPSSDELLGIRSSFDSFGGPVTLASGELPLGSVGSPTIVSSLGDPGSFGDGEYSGTRTGAVSLTLTLISVRAGTRTEEQSP